MLSLPLMPCGDGVLGIVILDMSNGREEDVFVKLSTPSFKSCKGYRGWIRGIRLLQRPRADLRKVLSDSLSCCYLAISRDLSIASRALKIHGFSM